MGLCQTGLEELAWAQKTNLKRAPRTNLNALKKDRSHLPPCFLTFQVVSFCLKTRQTHGFSLDVQLKSKHKPTNPPAPTTQQTDTSRPTASVALGLKGVSSRSRAVPPKIRKLLESICRLGEMRQRCSCNIFSLCCQSPSQAIAKLQKRPIILQANLFESSVGSPQLAVWIEDLTPGCPAEEIHRLSRDAKVVAWSPPAALPAHGPRRSAAAACPPRPRRCRGHARSAASRGQVVESFV